MYIQQKMEKNIFISGLSCDHFINLSKSSLLFRKVIQNYANLIKQQNNKNKTKLCSTEMNFRFYFYSEIS